MIVLSGADLVLPDRILSSATLVVDQGRIVDLRGDTGGTLHHHYIVPGFIDVHVHGVDGVDVLETPGAVAAMAQRLPRYGVTSFCPTTVASGPEALRAVLGQVRDLRQASAPTGARALPAHVESNFINPAYRGAQPFACLRMPRDAFAKECEPPAGTDYPKGVRPLFSAADILAEIDRAAPDVGIVTIAPELDGALDLTAWLTARGHAASLGHSAASFEEAQAAIAAGARRATHLFNCMPPFHHRAPGLVGAILQTEEVAAELICDGVHLHPAVIRAAVGAKRPSRVLAVTDGTAGAGLPVGARSSLGGRPITVRDGAAYLDDGTLAGGTATMDQVFRTLVGLVGLTLVDAVTLCSTTAARELGLVGYGLLAKDAVADMVILDRHFTVVQTYVGGELVYSSDPLNPPTSRAV